MLLVWFGVGLEIRIRICLKMRACTSISGRYTAENGATTSGASAYTPTSNILAVGPYIHTWKNDKAPLKIAYAITKKTPNRKTKVW